MLGEERRLDTWYIPLDAPEILEFLCERKKESEGKIRNFTEHIWDTVAQHQQGNTNRIKADWQVA